MSSDPRLPLVRAQMTPQVAGSSTATVVPIEQQAPSDIQSAVLSLLQGSDAQTIVKAHRHPGCRIARLVLGNQNVPNAVNTVLVFDKTVYDSEGISSGAGGSRLTIKTAGRWQVLAAVLWNAVAIPAVGDRVSQVRLNGGALIGLDRAAGDASGYASNVLSFEYQLAAGDYIELEGFQTSGAPLGVVAGVNYSPVFSVRLLEQV